MSDFWKLYVNFYHFYGPSIAHLLLDNAIDSPWSRGHKHSNTPVVIEPAFGTFGSLSRCKVILQKEISISIKFVIRAKSALKFPRRQLQGLWTWSNIVVPTVPDSLTPHIVSDWKFHSGPQSAWISFLFILAPDYRTLISKLHEKRP